MPSECAQMVDLLGELHCRYDGAPPKRARQEMLAGGPALLENMRADARQRLLGDQCAMVRLAVARRRAMLTGRQCRRDRWLARLVADLVRVRTDAMGAGAHTNLP